MADIKSYSVGQLIELGDGRQCIIRFLGETSFAPGEWIGVEFDDASGKNDGSVQGERYFDCDMGHGMFLRPTGVAKVLEEPTPKPAKKVTAAASTSTAEKAPKATNRLSTAPTNGLRRQTMADPTATKRAALNAASPTPALRRQSVLNAQKSPTKPVGRTVASTATSSATSSRGVTPSTTARKPLTKPTTAPRSSLASRALKSNTTGDAGSSSPTSSSRPTRQMAPSSRGSGAGSAASITRPTNTSSSRLSRASTSKPATKVNGTKSVPKQSDQASPGSQTKEETASQDDGDRSESSIHDESEFRSEDNNATEEQGSDVDTGTRDAASPQKATASAPTLQPAQKTVALTRRNEELEAKLKLLEKKRSDDVEKLAYLEKLQAEKDKLERIRQALEAKLKPQSQELNATKSKLKELEEQIEKNEGILAEHESEMEMAMLDREMAEETAEALKMELEVLKQKQEELELEVEILREENAEFGQDVSAEDQSTRGWLQMERQNERYREALVRLRDVSQSTEAELKEQIAALQEDLKQLEGIKEQYDETVLQLQQSEAAIENLKQQLEAALASEDMVEELAETNNNLSEENRRLRVEIDDLQTINELNDEFELQHAENEKQMQDEIDSRGAALIERANHAIKQDEKLAEYEYTINRFREVVTNLQSHIEDLKASQQISDVEADELNLRSKAMTDLNMRLQNSAAKAQINTVDLEMRRLEAQEASEHLAIVQMFLPDGFKQERDSVLVYLRFKRLAFKAGLLCSLLRDRVSGSSFLVSSEGAFVYCEIMDKLTWVSAMCDRFVSDIKGCSLDRFNNYERALPELDPVERALNRYIEVWKKDDLREREVTEELQRTMALLTHLSEIHIEESLSSYADEAYMRTTLMQSHLETAATAITLAKTMLERISPDNSNQDQIDESQLEEHLQQLNNLISQTRSAKVTASKALTSVAELRSRSMSLKPDTSDAFAECLSLTGSIASHATILGSRLYKASDDTSSMDVPAETSVRNALSEFRNLCFPDSPTSSDPLASFSAHIRHTSSRTASLLTSIADFANTAEFTRPATPWVLRAEALTSISMNNVSAEAEVQRLKDALHERINTLRVRDQAMEEQNVKIELLEARMRDATTKTKRIEELQKQVEGYKRREREMVQEVEKKFREAENLKVERDKWKVNAEQKQYEDSFSRRGLGGGEKAVATVRELETLKMEIKGLQGAVRYLRSDNLQSRYADATTTDALSWLNEPLLPTKTQREKLEKQEKMEKEGAELLRSVIHLATTANLVDMSKLPDNKLAWRPAREKSSWIVAKHAQEWEGWNRKRKGFVVKAQEYVGVNGGRGRTA